MTIPQVPKCPCSNPACQALGDLANQFLDTLYETLDDDRDRLIAATSVVARLAVEHRLQHEQLFHLLLTQMLDIATAIAHEPEAPTLQLVKS